MEALLKLTRERGSIGQERESLSLMVGYNAPRPVRLLLHVPRIEASLDVAGALGIPAGPMSGDSGRTIGRVSTPPT